ncbi:MAG TPA: hypothetical protein DEP28_03335 [Bacteroidetes bacterium]|nr:hypothetical protein [Bacteroidota bacterium]HCN36601.1 hypothetical protein [Bacteroidota bacterium]
MKELLLKYTRYNHWANERICLLLTSLPAEILDKEIKSSFTSIRKTLYHLWDAELIWIERINGFSFDKWPSESFDGDIVEATQLILTNSNRFSDLVSNNDEEYLNKRISYQNMKGDEFNNPVWELIMHCMNHSTFHRGQIVTMLREADVKDIPGTDLILYYRSL